MLANLYSRRRAPYSREGRVKKLHHEQPSRGVNFAGRHGNLDERLERGDGEYKESRHADHHQQRHGERVELD